MSGNDTQMNPGKAGPKGALEEAPAGKPSSGAPGAEGNNTRRDFVKLAKHRKENKDDGASPSGAANERHR